MRHIIPRVTGLEHQKSQKNEASKTVVNFYRFQQRRPDLSFNHVAFVDVTTSLPSMVRNPQLVGRVIGGLFEETLIIAFGPATLDYWALLGTGYVEAFAADPTLFPKSKLPSWEKEKLLTSIETLFGNRELYKMGGMLGGASLSFPEGNLPDIYDKSPQFGHLAQRPSVFAREFLISYVESLQLAQSQRVS